MRVEEELKTYLQVLWHYKWIIICCALLASTVAFGISTQLIPQYAATATVRVASAPGGAADYMYISMLSRLSNTYVEIATSDVSLNEVMKRLGLKEKPDVEVEIVPDTELIRITASDQDPARASDIANTLASLMMEQSTQLYGGNAPTAREIIEGQLQQAEADLRVAVSDYEDALSKTKPSTDRTIEGTPVPNPDLETLSHVLYVRQQIYADLLQRYEDARTSEQVYANAITIIAPATLPDKPDRPNIPMNTALGFVAGLAAGLILAFLFESTDDTVRGVEDAGLMTSLPILCTIPEMKRKLSRDKLHFYQNGQLASVPAFRQLRARLTLAGAKPKSSSFLITSPEPAAGKTTISANLALSLAEAGNPVVLLDMDFYRPRLHSMLQLQNEAGLSEFLADEISLDGALQNTPYPNLRVITAGSHRENVSEWLTPLKIGALLKQLHKDGSYVVIDAPAFLSVAEPTMIASQVDAVIVVIAGRSTERRNLHLTVQQLVEIKARVHGIVVNRVPNTQLSGYYEGQPQRRRMSFRWNRFTHQHVTVPDNSNHSDKA